MKKRYWLVIPVIAVLAIIAVFYFNRKVSMAQISQERFEQMIQKGDVSQVTFVSNQNLAEITLKHEAIIKPEYWQDLEKMNAFALNSGPHYKLKIANPELFDRRFIEAQKDIPASERIGYSVEERTGIASLLINWGFLLLLLFISMTAIMLYFVWAITRFLERLKSNKKSSTPSVDPKSEEVAPQQADVEYFPVKTGEKTIFVAIDKIMYFYAEDNYVYIHDTEDNKYLTEYTLTDLEVRLPSQFVRIHRSYIVNKLLIKEIRRHSGNRFTVLLYGKKSQQLVSSQSYAPKVKELIKF